MAYLWLMRWPPFSPLKGGDIDYSRELTKSLAQCAPIDALTFSFPGVTPPQVEGMTWRQIDFPEPPRLASLASALPNVAFRHASTAYLEAAAAAAPGADAIFVDFIGMFWIVRPLVERLKAHDALRRPPVIVVDHNFEHDIRRDMVAHERSPIMRLALGLDAWKAGRLERIANALADGLVANTDADSEKFARIVSTPRVTVMPAYAGPKLSARSIDAGTPPRICILGNHDAYHKRMVLELTLDALMRAGLPEGCIVEVVGSGDNTAFEAKYPGIRFLGYVDDIVAYLQTVRFGLIPDEVGGGFKHRALMHAFLRTPMLALDKALAGMGFVSGEHFAGAETLDELAKQLPGLLEDFPRLNRLQEQAFAHCENAFNWADRGADLHAFAQSLRSSPQRRAPR